MWNSNNWKQYELIDSSFGERLEKWGDVTVIRPDPQAIWETPRKNPCGKGGRAVQALVKRRRKLGILQKAPRKAGIYPRRDSVLKSSL